MQHTLTTSGTLYKINRHRAYFEEQIQKRRALGYCIKILLVIAIGAVCWYLHPVPSFDKGEPVLQTTHGDR